MRRALVLMLIASSAIAAPPEKWWDAYNRGVAAVNAKNYDAAAAAMQKAIAENPTEGTAVRAGRSIITYVPHFWLGIAKFNLGDTDGALREWRISEEQGAVARTAYYSKMKDWVARAQTEKQRDAQDAASGPKKAAETALSRALEMQGNAMSAGGDRTTAYRDAQRKLQDALGQFRKAGTDVNAYKATEQTAQQAASMFSAAAMEGQKLKAAAAARPKPQPAKPLPIVVPVAEPPRTETVAPQPVAPPVTPAPVVSQAKVAAEIAVQEYRRRAGEVGNRAEIREADALRARLANARSDADYDRVRLATESRDAALTKRIAAAAAAVTVTAAPTPMPTPAKLDLAPAYRAFAAGNLDRSEQTLTQLLAATPAAEAYLLRGCVRYTRAMLSRTPDALLAAATDDFKAALQRNRALRLDPDVFSPKLVARFEQVRNGR